MSIVCSLSVTSLLVCALLLLVVIPYGDSIQVTRSYQSTSPFHDILIDKFGLAVGGLVEIEYQVEATSGDETYSGDVVLLLITDWQQFDWYSSASTSTLCSQPSMFRRELRGQGRETVVISPEIGRSQFSAMLLQCRTSSGPVAISVTATMKNPRPSSSEYSHKAIEDVAILQLLEGRVIVFTLLALGVLGQLHFCRKNFTPLHLMFLATLFLLLIFSIADYKKFQNHNESGEESLSDTLAVNVLSLLSSWLLQLCLLLLSAGWAIVRSILSDRELNGIVITFSVYLVFGLADAVCLNRSQAACYSLGIVTFILGSLILLGIIVAINFTATQLRITLNNTPWTPSTPIQYARLKQYQVFRFAFVMFLIMPTVISIITLTMTWKEKKFLVDSLQSVLEILMLLLVGIVFSPLDDEMVLRAFDGTAAEEDVPAEQLQLPPMG